MIELYRDPDFVKVGFYQSVLEEAGIQTHIRNADGSSMAGVMIPDVYPALCIVNDSDFKKAWELLQGIEHTVLPNTDRLDKPWLVIWLAILLLGPLIFIGMIGLVAILFDHAYRLEPTLVHASDTGSVVDISYINMTPTSVKLFASTTILIPSSLLLFTIVRLARRSILSNKNALLENLPKD